MATVNKVVSRISSVYGQWIIEYKNRNIKNHEFWNITVATDK